VRRWSADISEIQVVMTPFVDVVFSLLIFFVVTVRFVPPEMRVPLFLSVAVKSSGGKVSTEPFVITVHVRGENSATVIAAGSSYEIDQLAPLKSELEAYRQRNSKDGVLLPDARVVVAPDGDVIWQHTMSVIDLAKGAGLPVGMPGVAK
jgi:biopolymer transport protein ExbD